MRQSSKVFLIGLSLLILIIVSGILHTSYSRHSSSLQLQKETSDKRTLRQSASTAPSKEKISFYFNNPLLFTKPNVNSNSEIGSALIDLIDSANVSIDFAIYGLGGQPKILKALENALERGVTIRGVVDKDTKDKNFYRHTDQLIKIVEQVQDDYAADLATKASKEDTDYTSFWPAPEGFSGVPQEIGYSLPDNKAIIAVHAGLKASSFHGDIMHNKFFIIDDRKVWTGSANLSDTGTGGYNANIACIIEDETLAAYYLSEFNQMYDDGLFHRNKLPQNKETIHVDDDTSVDVYFSPQDDTLTNALQPLISNATDSIDISVFYLTDKNLTADLIKAHNRGVSVRIILDAFSAQNGYTKHEILRGAGLKVKVENWGGKMHMKSMIVDNKYLVVGSMNFSASGIKSNDENTLVITSDHFARKATDFFNLLWNSIPDDYLVTNPAPESYESIHSMKDGIDNDSDKLVDIMDDGYPEIFSLPPYKIVPKEDGYDLIKGISDINGGRFYLLPTDSNYTNFEVDGPEDYYFPSIIEAKEAGFEAFDFDDHVFLK